MFVLCLLHILIYSIYLYCWTNKFTKLIGVAKEILNKRAFLSLFKLWSQNRVVTYLWQILKIFNLISNMQQTRSPYLFYFEDMNLLKIAKYALNFKNTQKWDLKKTFSALFCQILILGHFWELSVHFFGLPKFKFSPNFLPLFKNSFLQN